MEQDKTKLLSDLYAIRATMSVIAENDDAIQPERDTVEEISNALSQTDSLIEESKMNLGEALSEKRDTTHTQIEELCKERENCEKELTKKQSFRDWCEKELVHSKKFRGLTKYLWDAFTDHVVDGDSVPCCIWIGLLIVCIIASFICAGWRGPQTYWIGLLYNILITAGIILLYMFITSLSIALYKKHADVKKFEKFLMKCNCEIKQKTNRIPEIDSKIEELKEFYAATSEHMKYDALGAEGIWKGNCRFYFYKAAEPKYHYAEIDNLIQEHEREIEELESQRTELERQRKPHQEMVNANAEKTALIVKEGTTAYPLIDFRDWENVDLLIYYFETGRADDMKEALQLVDKQRQADQITEAIEAASKSICKTINVSMKRLGSALAESFNVLSRQMTQQHAEMMHRMDRQTEDWREISEMQNRELRGLREQAAAEMSMQVSAQAMNQALLNKISVSSKHLADQMDRQMREVHGLY